MGVAQNVQCVLKWDWSVSISSLQRRVASRELPADRKAYAALP
jgi:hypothetical protein